MRTHRMLFGHVLLPLTLSVTAVGQTTYTWNQTGTASWTTSTNWTPTRTTPVTNDILIIDGSQTASPIIASVPMQSVGQLFVKNNARVVLTASAAAALTIGGGPGVDFSIEAGSTLIDSANSAITISIASGATGSVSGTFIVRGSTAATGHQLLAADASSLTFESGSTCRVDTLCSGSLFSGTGTANTVIFSSGSVYVQKSGSNPFGLGQPSSKVVFQTGSLFRLDGNITPAFSGRTYADVELNVPAANITVTGTAAVVINNLTITAGTLNFNMTATPGHAIKGNIAVASGQTLNFNPASAGTVNLDGSSSQTVSGSGTVSCNASSTIAISNSVGVTLQRAIATSGAVTVSGNGILNCGTNNVTGSGSFTLASGGTIIIGSPQGIATTGSTGNIQVSGQRAFNASSIYSYQGTTAQSTGSGLPTTIAELRINNVAGLALTQSVTLTSVLTLTNGQLNIAGNSLTLSSGATISRQAGSLSAAPTFGTSVNVSYSGTSPVTTGVELPTASSVLNNLAINNAAGVTLHASTTVNGTLTFTSGNLSTGATTLTVASAGSISRSSGHVVGNLRVGFGTGTNIARTFVIGSGTTYGPVNVTISSVSTSGSLIATTVGSKHPSFSASGLSATKSINRYWTLTNEGTVFMTYDATFNYENSDLDAGANTASFAVKRFSTGAWSSTTTGTRTATTTQATGLNAFGDFAVGEFGAASIEVTSGNNQSGAGGTKLSAPFTVTVRDLGGNPVSGISVTFAIASSPPGAAGQKLSVTDTTTNANGQAATFLTLGDKVGAYGVTASSTGLTGSPLTFAALASSPSSVEKIGEVPKEFALLQNYPNPFNPRTNIEFQIPNLEIVRLGVYDILGREVATLIDGELAPGIYKVRWDASLLPSGVYVYRMKAGSYEAVRKLVLTK